MQRRPHRPLGVECLEPREMLSTSAQIIDDGAAGYSSVGSWLYSSGQGYGGDVRYSALGSGNDGARWTFNVTPGQYRVSASWFAHSNRASNAPYTIVEGSNVLGTVRVSQKVAANDVSDAGTNWEYLGGPYNITSNTLVVTLSDAANGYVIADAVRVEPYVGPPIQIVDNGNVGFSKVGNWPYSAGQGYGGDVHYSALGSGSDVARWTFTVTPGRYRVSASWFAHANRASNAPYTIFNGSTALGTVRVSQKVAANDFSDAGTSWEDLGGPYDITGNTLVVELSDAANGYVIADAVRIERLADNAPAGDIIDASRRIDWSQAGVTGGIPNRTTVCATLNPGATAQQINSAITACPENQVVYLNAGTYNLSAGIDFYGKNNVTLRGAGPDQTLLNFTGSSGCRGMGADICLGPAGSGYYVESPAHVADWTAGYTKGTTQITLSNTIGLAVGMVIVLDQLDDAADTGGVFVCSANGVCADEGPGGAGRTNRAQTQIVKVTSISGNTVTITPGIYMSNWRDSQSPQAFWGNSTGFAFGMGVEGVTVDNSTNNSGNRSNIYLIWCYDCSVKNVRSINADRNHVWLYETARSTVRDSYFYGTKNAQSQSYGVESYMGSDNLIENNIFQHITAPLMMGGATQGSVQAYNYLVDMYYTPSPGWMIPSNSLHAAGTDMILHEGNDGTGIQGDLVHGTHNFNTAFRNYFSGLEPGKSMQTVPVNFYSFSRFMNIVGNVLGTAGYHNNYESVTPTFISKDQSIYRLGDSGNLPSSKEDPLVKSTLLRWGNYDTVTAMSRFLASEVPSGLSQYANPVPPDQNLPASLYLPGKPSWWPTSTPWPAIGPDVTGGNISGVGGHAYKIPARLCYENTSKTNGILNFNAVNCYSP